MYELLEKIMRNRNVLIVLIAAAFALASLIIGMLSVNIYETVGANTSRQELSYASGYIGDKIRTSDGNVIRTASLEGETPALVMESYEEGVTYETWFFAAGGFLKELTVVKGDPVSAGQGDNIIVLKSADFAKLSDYLLEIRLVSTESDTCIVNYHVPPYSGGIQ